MNKIRSGLSKALGTLSVILMITLIADIVLQVVCRTFLPKTPAWTEELARYLFIYIIAISSGLSVQAKDFVSVDIVSNFFKGKSRVVYDMVINIFLLCFIGYFSVMCVHPFITGGAVRYSTALLLPMQFVYYSLYIMSAMMIVFYIFEIIDCALKLRENEVSL